MTSYNLFDLILIVPFIVVVGYGLKRYSGHSGVIKVNRVLRRLAAVHVGASFICWTGYALALAKYSEDNERLAPRGCGQALLGTTSDLTLACGAFLKWSVPGWAATTCILFGGIGLALIIRKANERAKAQANQNSGRPTNIRRF